jgi:serine/threonine-protein kinase
LLFSGFGNVVASFRQTPTPGLRMPEPKPKSVQGDVPADILPILRQSGILPERVLEDLRAKVLAGNLPFDSRELAQRLVKQGLLTEYQARRILTNRPHGLIVGRYVIQERIGSGAMGRVYKAQHQLMDRVVALKIIAPEIVSNARVVARFQREMKMVGRLDHPNVVRAFDADQLGTTLFIVMEYVCGRSLSQKFKAEGAQPPLAVAEWAAQAARGLTHAHEQNIVHRDVKPSNLLLGDTGQVKVLDLGLGILQEADENATFATADGIAVGTIDYMSPEQACGREVDRRSDLYSLGCTMYHLIAGRLPFPGDSPVERLGKRLSGNPVPIRDVQPEVSPALAGVLDRMLAARPTDRFPSGDEVADALLAAIRPRAAAPPKKPAPRTAEPSAPAPVTVTVAAPPAAAPPEFPAWFRPLADLAQRRPTTALLAILTGVAVAFAAGFVTALLTR